jgi:hypothetical protein
MVPTNASDSSAWAPWTTLISVRRTIHIFTSAKQPWVTLPADAKAVPEFYDLDIVWSAESLERRRLMRAKAPQTWSTRFFGTWICFWHKADMAVAFGDGRGVKQT